ncbi:C6 transcription factor [Penicillium herquei]|nr:C6 transcription factor [Penicillium herquei]
MRSVDTASLLGAAMPHLETRSDLEMEGLDSGLTAGLLSGVAVRYQITKGGQPSTDAHSSSIRSSFFGLLPREPRRRPMSLPHKGVARDLANAFFRCVNPYTPVLHHGEFQKLLDELYSNPTGQHLPLKLYTVFIVFAIGAAKSNKSDRESSPMFHDYNGLPRGKRRRLSVSPYTPEDYKESAMAYLDSYMSEVPSFNFLARLEELQAVLLLCIFTLLKPGIPTLTSLLDMAIHSATDLRLYSDHSSMADINSESFFKTIKSHSPSKSSIQELRRRLWWSLYSLERLVAPYLDRPFFTPDEVITTRFPDLVDKHLYSKNGTHECFQTSQIYNHITHHHLKLRCLQSEIHRMIQYQYALLAQRDQPLEHRWKAPPFLKGPYTFNSWRSKMIERLDEWRRSIPRHFDTKLDSYRALLELEYWQTTITLYRRGISIPEDLVQVASLNNLMSESTTETVDERNKICFVMAHACQRVIEIYREMQLSAFSSSHIAYLATDWIFIAGESRSYAFVFISDYDYLTQASGSFFLFSVWNSSELVDELSFQTLDSTLLTTTAILQSFEFEYPAAKLFRGNFEKMSAKTVQHYSTTKSFRKKTLQLFSQDLYCHSYNDSFQQSTQRSIHSTIFELNTLTGSREEILKQFDHLSPVSRFSWVSEDGIDSSVSTSDLSSALPLTVESSEDVCSDSVKETKKARLLSPNSDILKGHSVFSVLEWDFPHETPWTSFDDRSSLEGSGVRAGILNSELGESSWDDNLVEWTDPVPSPKN